MRREVPDLHSADWENEARKKKRFSKDCKDHLDQVEGDEPPATGKLQYKCVIPVLVGNRMVLRTLEFKDPLPIAIQFHAAKIVDRKAKIVIKDSQGVPRREAAAEELA